MEYVLVKSKKDLSRLKITGDKEKDCFGNFEKFLFGEQFGNPEENTERENRLWEILKEFSSGTWDTKNKPKEVLKAFHLMKSCADYYKKLLTPNAEVLYRGISLTPSEMMDLSSSKNPENTENIRIPSRDVEQVYVYDYEYSPLSYIQSWTRSIKVGVQFAFASRTAQYPAILRKKVDNSFFGNPSLTEKIEKDLNPLNDLEEEEIYRLGGLIKCKLLVPDISINKIEKRKRKFKKK